MEEHHDLGFRVPPGESVYHVAFWDGASEHFTNSLLAAR
jgi:hypothetical protein